MRAVFASRNPHKIQQVRLLLPGVELVALEDVLPALELEEPFDTFEANALSKARAVVGAAAEPAIADDSGLEVDALGGDPGVRSARYAGPGATDADNNRKLVEALRDLPEDERSCRYRCVAAYVDPSGMELIAHGSCEGTVVTAPRGELGFGYDPHVVPEGEARTMGEIPLMEKLRFSHRGRAFRALHEQLVRAGVVVVDPIEQFGVWMDQARAIGIALPNAMTLATADEQGRPSARTVLLKGFDRAGFVFYTNYESRKGRELEVNPSAALVFYWGPLDRQVTVTGSVTKVSREESAAYFATRPFGSRVGAWASPQSRVIPGREVLDDALEELTARFAGGDVPLPPHWGGFRLEPDAIEFWEGRPNRLHDRIRYRRGDGGAWIRERLAP